MTAFALQSNTLDRSAPDARSGFGGQARYTYETRRVVVQTHVEHYDRTFQMDTAFQNRVGDTNGFGSTAKYNFYPEQGEVPLAAAHPAVHVQRRDPGPHSGR